MRQKNRFRFIYIYHKSAERNELPPKDFGKIKLFIKNNYAIVFLNRKDSGMRQHGL